MWEVFASVLSELINMGSPALLELPRGCDYWKDRRMTDLVEGTVSHEHKFDGCMYGLKSQFQETPQTNQETMEDCYVGGVFSEAA